MSKKFSIIIPAHNESPTLGEVIRCALGSNPQEVIVVDDGSTDDTAEVVRKSAKEDARVRLLRHKTNQGCGIAKRSGTSAAATNLLVYYDADVKNPRTEQFQLLAEPLLNNSADYVIGDFEGYGRVTEYLAKPLVNYFLPTLSIYDQPLSGMVGIRRPFVFPEQLGRGYASLAMVLDAFNAGARFTSVNIGKIDHDKRPDVDKFAQAREECTKFFTTMEALGLIEIDRNRLSRVVKNSEKMRDNSLDKILVESS